MKRNKVGSLFLVSVLALAGIGISYAGFSDNISVYGSVNTATLSTEIMTGWYSGTWVYKIWGFPDMPEDPVPGNPADIQITYDPANEILIYHGFVQFYPGEDAVEDWATNNFGNAELESSAYATSGLYVFPDGTASDVDMVYDNLFPCIDFSADFIFHYTGSIPGRINTATIFPILYDINYPDSEELAALWAIHQANPTAGFGAWVEAYRALPILGTDGQTIIGWTIDHNQPVDVGYQLHNCNYVYVKLTIHLPQDNYWQGMNGAFGGTIGVQQWADTSPD